MSRFNHEICRPTVSVPLVIALAWSIISPATAYSQRSPSIPDRMLLGSVVDTSGRGIGYAYVSEAGSRQFVVSDYEGAFRLSVEMPGGTIRLSVRKIGFRPIDTTITVSPGNTDRLRLFTEALPVSLATVHVAGAAGYDAYLDQRGYYRRWAAIGGLGFIGPEAIDRRNPAEATQMLRDVPGVRVESLGGNKGVKKNFVLGRGGLCVLGVVLDGQRVEIQSPPPEAFQPRIQANVAGRPTFSLQNPSEGNNTSIDELVAASGIKAIEVYPSAASVPTEFQMHAKGCGLIVIWTKYN